MEIPEKAPKQNGEILSVDLGENNLATTSHGTIYGGKELRHNRDKFLGRRSKLQSNGSRAAKSRLRKISGRERRHVKETNHCVSKSIVKEAVKNNVATIVMEDLTNIRKRIRGGKYKAKAEGIGVVYVNPAYTSLTCSFCGALGSRHKHCFKCTNCGSFQHSDRNACQNLCKLAGSAVPVTASVNMPWVATLAR